MAIGGIGNVTSIHGTRTCLECRIGPESVLLAADIVDVLAEYVVGAPLPLSDRRSRTRGAATGAALALSLGLWSGQAVLSVAVIQHPSALSRSTQGILLDTGSAGLRWAIEIDAASGFVDVGRIGAALEAQPWRRLAILPDGRTVPYLDVPALLRELAMPSPVPVDDLERAVDHNV
jgi:hypothetical protein